MVAGARLGAGRVTSFQNRWPGTYSVVDAAGAPLALTLRVDGVERPTPLNLEQAGFQIEATCEECNLVPSDVVGQVQPQRDITPADLYERPYTR